VGHLARASVAVATVVVIGVAAAISPAVGGAAGGEASAVVSVGTGEPPAEFSFGISPTSLPPADPGATSLDLAIEESRSAAAGTAVGLSEAKIGLDRSIQFDPRELPDCHRLLQIDLGPDRCHGDVVGQAEADVEVAYPEGVPIELTGRGPIYNDGVHPRGTQLIVDIPIEPMPGVLRLVVPVERVKHGRIGSEATIKVPMIAGGSGSLRDLRLELRRGFNRDGERVGYVDAECRDGKLAAWLSAVFRDGTTGQQEPAVRACRASGHAGLRTGG
jgi:hypothetical protein